MPTYLITAPDGTKYKVTGPGTEQDALAHVQSQYGGNQSANSDSLRESNPGEYDSSSPEFQKNYGPTGSFGQNLLAGVGRGMVNIGRGVKQVGAEIADAVAPEDRSLSGLIVGKKSRADRLYDLEKDRRELDAPLMKTGGGKIGTIVGGVATAVPAAFVPGANTVVGAGLTGAAFGASQPVTDGKDRLLNTAVGGATGAVSQYLGGKVAAWAQNKMASRATSATNQEAQNIARDATLKEAQQAGYVVPPSTTNPTVTNGVIESVAGKAQTQQAAAVKNQQVTNRLARKALGLGENTPLNKSVLNSVRSKAGNVYKAIEATGEIAVDGQYVDDLAAITNSIDDVAKDFPDLNLNNNEQINSLVDGMLQDRFSAKSAVELTKQLRKAASGNLSGANATDPAKRALGYAQRDAAAAVEDQLVRHLESVGSGGLAQRFDDARKLVAKTYSVESALNEGTGNVVAAQLGSQLKRGKPLSGELELVAKFARSFDKAAQEIKTSPGVSAVDAIVGGIGGATINPSLFAIPVARIGARSAITSQGINRVMAAPNYAPGKVGTTALELLRRTGKTAALPAAVYSSQQ
ncbi:MAG: hypothetical protein ACKO0Z_24550 [Betaproteobacteria bacterium]